MWIKASAIAVSMTRDAKALNSRALPCIEVKQETIVLKRQKAVRLPGNVSARETYESDMADVGWELGLRDFGYGVR